MQTVNVDVNKALLRRHFEEVLNQGELDVVDEIYSERYVLDAPVQTEGSVEAHGETHGREGLKRRVTLFRTAFPDIHFSVDNMLAEGDQVAVQYTFSGKHTGKFGEMEPTGSTISVTGILIALDRRRPDRKRLQRLRQWRHDAPTRAASQITDSALYRSFGGAGDDSPSR